MAENSNNGQERGPGHLLDKENLPNPQEQNQPKPASRMIQNPLQDSQLCNLTTNSEMRNIESTQDSSKTESGTLGNKSKSNWLTDIRNRKKEEMKEKNLEAKSSLGTKRKINTPKRSRSTSEKGHQSNVRKSDVKDLPSLHVAGETPNNSKSAESTEEDSQLCDLTTNPEMDKNESSQDPTQTDSQLCNLTTNPEMDKNESSQDPTETQSKTEQEDVTCQMPAGAAEPETGTAGWGDTSQDSQLCDLTTNPKMDKNESSQDPTQTSKAEQEDVTCQTPAGATEPETGTAGRGDTSQKPEVKSSPGTKKKNTPNRSRLTSEKDQPSTSQKREVPDIPEELPPEQRSPKKLKFKEEQSTSVFKSEETKDAIVIYEYKGIERKVKANPNTTIIDVVKQNHSINMKKYLVVSTGGSGAVINPWVPCGALTGMGKLCINLRQYGAPEPSVYPKFSDLKSFTVKDQKKHRSMLRKTLYSLSFQTLIVFGHKDESIREALERDTRFNVTYKVYIGKKEYPPYLSIHSKNLRSDINSMVPCGALEDSEELTVSIRQGKSCESHEYPVYPDGMFIKLDKNRNLKSKLHEKHYYNKKPLAVYGSKDQSIREALENDKRFNISGEFVLQHSAEPDCTSDLHLSELKQQNFYVISGIKQENRAPKVQDSQTTGNIRVNVPRDSSTISTETPKDYKKYPSLYTATSIKFSNAFNNLPERVKSEIWKKSRINYYNNLIYKSPITAKLLETLNKHKDCVGIIGYKPPNNKFIPEGTVMLLTKDLALTCHHVVKMIKESYSTEVFDVVFNYNEEPFIVQYFAQARTVFDSEPYDFAFLEIGNYNSPITDPEAGLYPHVAHPPKTGAVSIIGHPGGECKKVDVMCSVIEYEQRLKAIVSTILADESFLHLFTMHNYVEMIDKNKLTYDSCMYHGSSGAPVFNEKGFLVAMHSGGYHADIPQKKKSVIEYGRCIYDIIDYGIKNHPPIGEHLKDFYTIIERNSDTMDSADQALATPI